MDGDGFTVTDGDCDDNEGWANPDVNEICDGIDNNCDGTTDEGCTDTDAIKDLTGGCACASGSSAPPYSGLVFAVAAMLCVARRRRDQ